MYSKQFENFLAECLINWANNAIQPGFRYQFKSPDIENSRDLYSAFIRKTGGNLITYLGHVHPYINCNGIKLIPVLNDEEGKGFTENYISHLRDQVASQNKDFSSTSLLIIHNSMLDTLINSAMDVATNDAIWHPAKFAQNLKSLIQPGSSTASLFNCLLEDQLDFILEEGATIFGFKALFHSLENEKINFEELGLFQDPILLTLGGQPTQVKNRLDENRKLRSHIDELVEHYSDFLDSVLPKFNPKFINDHFYDKKDWKNVSYQEYLDALKSNKEQGLQFDRVEITNGIIFTRAKSSTKSGQKEQSVLIQIPLGESIANLEFIFQGNDLQENQVLLKNNRVLQNSIKASVNRLGGKNSRARFAVPFTGKPTFFSVELKRENTAEEYKFRCLLVQQNDFYFEEAKNYFKIEPIKECITLQVEENKFRIAKEGDSEFKLLEDQNEIDISRFSIVDFEEQSTKNDLIQFIIISNSHQLKINIEGPTAQEAISVPLLFEKERAIKLFRDDINAEYYRGKHRIVFENAEHNVIGVRQQLLDFEADLISSGSLEINDHDNQLKLEMLSSVYKDLYNSYKELFNYYLKLKTLPSLVTWGPEYRVLVQNVINDFEKSISSFEINRVLSVEQKMLMRIGLFRHEEKERLTSIHPLVLSYHLNLVSSIIEEKKILDSNSFSELPDVTLNRLGASGLMPFVPHAHHDYAYLTPVRENRFWIDIIPQKDISHNFVRRLVKDKLFEFITAYKRIFSTGNTGPLVINAIHQAQSQELFLGVIDYFKKEKEKSIPIHVNLYDDKLQQNDFDKFSESGKLTELKIWLELNSSDYRAESDLLIDLIRGKLTYSKFETPQQGQVLKYAHLAFFRNNVPVECTNVKISKALSGVLCNGLIAGEAAEIQGDSYFTSFGLRNVEIKNNQPLRLAKLIGSLWGPAILPNSQYLGLGIGLAVSSNFKELLIRSYDSALWTTIIDPKVTLDFFTLQKNVVLIHYSDQYTSSSGYDAITVTKQVGLFKNLLNLDDCRLKTEKLLSEFNSFNGEWLLKMLTAPATERKEKHGIIGAYKFVSVLLRDSDISWVPLSVAEMIRVSGNIGLKMNESEFSRKIHGYKKGAISDDVLFVGFKNDKLYLLPLEVKTGSRPDFSYAGQQALELGRYLKEEVLGQHTLAARLYRSLFIRQVLMQVEKFKLYKVLDESRLHHLLEKREWWQQGDYSLGSLDEYADGIVLAHIESDTFFSPEYERKGNLIQIQLPYGLLPALISADSGESLASLVKSCNVPSYLVLGNLQEKQSSVQVQLTTKSIVAAKPEIKNTTLPGDFGNTVNLNTKTNVNEVEDIGPLQILLGHESVRNEPLYWEPTNTAKFMNTNTGIIGTMGTGKTQFTKSLVTQLMRNKAFNVNGASIGLLIFDYKSDYIDDDFCNATNAKKLKLDRLPYNPLSLYGDMPKLPLHIATSFTETMAKAFGLGHKQQLRLRKLILDAYDGAGIIQGNSATWNLPAPTLANVWELFINQDKVEEDSLYAALDSLVSYEIFEPDPLAVQSLYDMLDDVTVIELAGYSPQVQNLVVALTLDLFYSQMQKRGKPTVKGDFRQITKMILVDEADNFMKEDFPSLRKILKEGREYGVGVILSTQDITHFKTGENNYASYILTWLIHRVAEIKNADIKAIFNKDDKSEQEGLMETIRKLDKHFSLYIDGDKNVRKMRDKAFWEL
jgi:DNA phosphorothioation-dependent restriction protein DptH